MSHNTRDCKSHKAELEGPWRLIGWKANEVSHPQRQFTVIANADDDADKVADQEAVERNRRRLQQGAIAQRIQ
jgi:hypothetical protein